MSQERGAPERGTVDVDRSGVTKDARPVRLYRNTANGTVHEPSLMHCEFCRLCWTCGAHLFSFFGWRGHRSGCPMKGAATSA